MESKQEGNLSFSALDFFQKNYGAEAFGSLEVLAESGSSRKYYRFVFQNESYILTESENVEENQCFLYLSEHFSQFIDNLPRVHKIASDYKAYTQSDLGDTSLMHCLESDRGASKHYFEESIRSLVKMQVKGQEGLDYSKCFSYPKFNSTLVLRDLFSFKNYFLNLTDIEFNPGKLLLDFEHFATDFESIPYQYFVFRDFQSRNIMIYEDRPYFIDYQGGLQGPPQYDLVSLIWQAKAQLSREWKMEFLAIYEEEFHRLSGEKYDKEAFQKAYELCLLERLLQVLGTYGLRGIYERKSHFIQSIDFALQNLAEIQELPLLSQYPELKKLIQKLSRYEFNKNQ